MVEAKIKFRKKLMKIGTSMGFTIPPPLQEFLNLKERDSMVILAETGKHGRYISIWKDKENVNDEDAKEEHNDTTDDNIQ